MEKHHLPELCPDLGNAIRFDLGTFEGYNLSTQSAIVGKLTAAEVVGWDHKKQGETQFRPSGDRAEVTLLFKEKGSVTGAELLALDHLLGELGGDHSSNFLKIHHAVRIWEADLAQIDPREIEDSSVAIYVGNSFSELRQEAASDVFENDSESWDVEEIKLNGQAILLVAPK